jgi:hypothetical protein
METIDPLADLSLMDTDPYLMLTEDGWVPRRGRCDLSRWLDAHVSPLDPADGGDRWDLKG